MEGGRKGETAAPTQHTNGSLGGHDERRPFANDVGCQFRRLAAADILRRMNDAGGIEQGLAGFKGNRLPALELVFQRSRDNEGDLLAAMRVTGGENAGREIDAHLHDLVSGHVDIVLEEIGALQRLFCVCCSCAAENEGERVAWIIFMSSSFLS